MLTIPFFIFAFVMLLIFLDKKKPAIVIGMINLFIGLLFALYDMMEIF